MKSVNLLERSGARRTPYIRQTEANGCGFACLAMVAGRYGLKADLRTLWRRFSPSPKGTTLKALMQIAEQIGLHARPLRGEIESLGHLPMPAILHWNLNHFVVLTRVSRGVAGTRHHIHNPARGAQVLGEAELSRHFNGVVLELTPVEFLD